MVCRAPPLTRSPGGPGYHSHTCSDCTARRWISSLAVIERVFRRTLEVFQLAAGRAATGEAELFSALGSAYGDLVTSDRRLLLATCNRSRLASTQRCARLSGGASMKCTATYKRSPELAPRRCTDSLRTGWCSLSVRPSTCLLLIGCGREASSKLVTQPERPERRGRLRDVWGTSRSDTVVSRRLLCE